MAGKRREREPLVDVPSSDAEALELVRSLARQLRVAEEEHRRLRDQFGQAVTVARMYQYSWVNIAEVTEYLSPALVQQRAVPLVDAGTAPGNTPRAVSPTEAASLLGVSRRTVHRMMSDGRLRVINDPSGRQRVQLEDGSADAPADQ